MKWTRKHFRQEVLSAAGPVLVEFKAGWSDPCRAMTQVVESVAKDPPIPVRTFSVSVEENESLTEECGVRAVPTVLIYNQGRLREQIVGRATEQEVREKLERVNGVAGSQMAVKTQPPGQPMTRL